MFVRILWIAALTLGIYLLAPSERDGASQIHLARARVATGAVELGESAPVFPGATVWTGALLAGVDQMLSISRRAEGESWVDYVRGEEDTNRMVLRWAFALLAAILLLRAVELAARTSGQRRLVIALWIGLALGPFVLEAVSRLGSGILAGWLLLELTAPWLRHPPRVGWASAVAGGVLLAWAPFCWPIVVLFSTIALRFHRPLGSLTGRLLLLGLLGAALDPSRLIDPQNGLLLVWLEWTRAGGFPPVGTAFAGRGLMPVGLAPAAVVLGVLGWTAWIWRRRESSLGPLFWFAGVSALIVIGPWIAGVEQAGAVQAAAVPMLILGVPFLVAEMAGLPKWTARLAPIAAGLSLIVAWSPVVRPQSTLAPAELGAQIQAELLQQVGNGLLLAERKLPGEASLPARTFLLPRDSRDPERYDFVYWPRWFVDFDYVLLSAGEVRENLRRGGVSAHFYGELLEDSDLVAQWGRNGQEGDVLYRLYRIRETSDWRDPLRTEDLSSLTPVPELGPYLSQLGSFVAEAGHRKTAVVLFEEGFRLAPGSVSMYNNLGSLYLLEEEWEAAARVLTDGLALAPESSEMLYNSGRAHHELGSYERAEQLLRRSVNLRPDFSDAHYELGRAFLAQKKRGLAQMALQNYLDLEPESPRRESVQSVLETLRGEQETSGVPEDASQDAPTDSQR